MIERSEVKELGRLVDSHLFNEMKIVDLMSKLDLNPEESKYLIKKMKNHPHAVRAKKENNFDLDKVMEFVKSEMKA